MDDQLNPLPTPTCALERVAKELMDGPGYRHWMLARATGTCAACGRPIEDGQKVRRGIHASCYQMTWRYVRRGYYTMEHRVQDGRIDPVLNQHPLTAEVRRSYYPSE